MKFILAVALFAVGALAAPTSAPNNAGRDLVVALEKRAGALLHRIHSTIEEVSKSGHHHLAGSLDHQAVMVEALAVSLRVILMDTKHEHSVHHIHVIEEDLLFLENRVSEEIAIIEHFQHGHHHHTGDDSAKLIARGEALVKEAKEAVAKFPKAKEVREIESEVIVVNALVSTLKAKPAPSAEEKKKDEEELARHEKTLRQLIEKASHRGDHH